VTRAGNLEGDGPSTGVAEVLPFGANRVAEEGKVEVADGGEVGESVKEEPKLFNRGKVVKGEEGSLVVRHVSNVALEKE
jgi:hypothetical protein